MKRPDPNAPNEQWTAWADAHYPFDGRDPKTARGFDTIRSEENPEMRGRMAWALCRQYPETFKPAAPSIPPMPDFGFGNIPEPAPEPEDNEQQEWWHK